MAEGSSATARKAVPMAAAFDPWIGPPDVALVGDITRKTKAIIKTLL